MHGNGARRCGRGYLLPLLLAAACGCDSTASHGDDAGTPDVPDVATEDAAEAEDDDAGGEAGEAGDAADADAEGDAGGDAPPDADGGARVGPRLDTFTPSGPIELTTGQEVTGLHVTSDDGPCIRGSGVTDVAIHDNRIGPCGPDAEGVGIGLEASSRVRIDHNAFDDVASALYVYEDGDELVFDHNLATRIRGPMPRGQLVQLNNVQGRGNRIVCNVSDQTLPGYLAGPEDHVNIFASSGTADSPIVVAHNKLRGGGPSDSGGGLLAGDNDSEYVEIADNVLVSPGQYGVAIAGGRYFRVLRNRIYSPDAHAWSNVGLYVWNQTDGTVCEGHEVSGNRVWYVNRDGTPNPCWNAGNCGSVAGWDTENAWGDPTLSAAMWDETFPDCE